MLTKPLADKSAAAGSPRSGHGAASVIPRLNEILERPGAASDADEGQAQAPTAAPEAEHPGSDTEKAPA